MPGDCVKRQLGDSLCANNSHDLSTFTKNVITLVKSTQISIDLGKMFVRVLSEILRNCTREWNQNRLSILGGLVWLINSRFSPSQQLDLDPDTSQVVSYTLFRAWCLGSLPKSPEDLVCDYILKAYKHHCAAIAALIIKALFAWYIYLVIP